MSKARACALTLLAAVLLGLPALAQDNILDAADQAELRIMERIEEAMDDLARAQRENRCADYRAILASPVAELDPQSLAGEGFHRDWLAAHERRYLEITERGCPARTDEQIFDGVFPDPGDTALQDAQRAQDLAERGLQEMREAQASKDCMRFEGLDFGLTYHVTRMNLSRLAPDWYPRFKAEWDAVVARGCDWPLRPTVAAGLEPDENDATGDRQDDQRTLAALAAAFERAAQGCDGDFAAARAAYSRELDRVILDAIERGDRVLSDRLSREQGRIESVPDPGAACGADGPPATIAGDYFTDYGRMDLDGGGGTYETSDGRLVVQRVDGNVVEGVWEQTDSLEQCPDGRYYGRFRFVFGADGFTGTYGYCGDAPDTPGWNGTRLADDDPRVIVDAPVCPRTYNDEILGPSGGRCRCDEQSLAATGTNAYVWGGDPYTNDSNICMAALHAGVIFGVGDVRVFPAPGQESYPSTEQNGHTTGSYGRWGGSITFDPSKASQPALAAAPAAPAPTPAAPRRPVRCEFPGYWRSEAAGFGVSHWAVNGAGRAVQSGAPNAYGDGYFADGALNIGVENAQYDGFYSVDLDENCNGVGKLTWFRSPRGAAEYPLRFTFVDVPDRFEEISEGNSIALNQQAERYTAFENAAFDSAAAGDRHENAAARCDRPAMEAALQSLESAFARAFNLAQEIERVRRQDGFSPGSATSANVFGILAQLGGRRDRARGRLCSGGSAPAAAGEPDWAEGDD